MCAAGLHRVDCGDQRAEKAKYEHRRQPGGGSDKGAKVDVEPNTEVGKRLNRAVQVCGDLARDLQGLQPCSQGTTEFD